MSDNKKNDGVRLNSLRKMIVIALVILVIVGAGIERDKRAPAPRPKNDTEAIHEKPTTDVLLVKCGEIVSADFKNATALASLEVVLPPSCASGRIEVPRRTISVSTCANAPITGNWYFPDKPRFPVPFEDKACRGMYPDVIKAMVSDDDRVGGMPVALDLQNPQPYRVKVTILLQHNPT